MFTLIKRRWSKLDHAQRFSITAAFSVLACALLFGWLLRSTAFRIALGGENSLAAMFVRHVVSTEFSEGLFSEPGVILEPELGERMLTALALEDVFRIKIYDRTGRIIWSDEAALLGVRFDDNENLDRALGGQVTSVIEAPDEDEHLFEKDLFESVMETYVPIHDGGSVVGVIELYRYPIELFRQTRRSGWVLWAASLGGGVLLYLALVGVVRRINETQRTLERQLRSSADELDAERSRLERIVNAMEAGLVQVDRRGTIVWANRRAETWFEEYPELLRCGSPRRLCDLESPCDGCPLTAALGPSNGPVRCERSLDEGGFSRRVFEIITTPEPLSDPADEPQSFLQLILDVTDVREVEAQLRHADKLSFTGQLAAGVAHQINNPVGILLTTITHHRTQLKQGAPSDGLRDDLEMMERQCRRVDRSVRSLLTFSRSPQGVKEPVDLREVVDEALLLSGPRVRQGAIEVETHIDERPCFTLGDSNDLLQALLNLANNAVDAMPEGGTLRIGLAPEQGDESVADDPRRLLLTVADTGAGFPEALLDRIFEPFFTTKEIGSGTGLGLAVSRRIVETTDGQMTAKNRPEGGALFEIRLPLLEGYRGE